MDRACLCVLVGTLVTIARAQTAAPSYSFSTLAGRVSSAATVDGAGANARFNRPWGIAVSADGNVYVTEAAGHTVRQVSAEGVVTTLAGLAATPGSADGTGTAARFAVLSTLPGSTVTSVTGPFGLAVHPAGNVIVADTENHTLRQITPAGVVSTIAGAAGRDAFLDGPMLDARFSLPFGVAVDSTGTIFVADSFNHVIRRITPAGMVSTIAGNLGDGNTTDGYGSSARFLHPTGIAVGPDGTVYVSECSNTVRRLIYRPQAAAWEVTTLAGTAGAFGNTDGVGAEARFGGPPPTNAILVTFTPPMSTFSASPGHGSYNITEMTGIAVDPAGNVFVADYGNHLIRKITPAGAVSTIGGGAAAGSTDGIGTAARFNRPTGIAVDAAGNLYIADSLNYTVRKGTLAAAPVFAAQPRDQTVALGATVVLAVTVTGGPAPTYRWTRNGTVIAGATTASLTLPNIQVASGGTFVVTATNSLGTATSEPFTVNVSGIPAIVTQPLSQTVTGGQTVTLRVAATGAPAPTYQWTRDGVAIPGATGTTLVLTNAQAATAGEYRVVATNSFGATTSAGAVVVVNVCRIVNLSIRTALDANATLIVGFVADGGTKPLLVRAVGPTLRGFGVADAMPDPQLSLHSGGSALASNDNWGTGTGAAQLSIAAAQVGAFPLAAGSLDAAILTNVSGAGTTAQASGRSGGGIVLVELYDSAPTSVSRLVNVSARSRVGLGDNALFAGFVLSGNVNRTLLIRAIGPTLGAFGVSGVLTDPRLDIFATGATTPLAGNDNWGGGAALVSAFTSVGAFGLPAATSLDAALQVTLPPGGYTARISGVGNTVGEALLEIYELP